MRFAAETLKLKALAALEEAALLTHEAPVRPTHSLRFALAFLYAVSDGERWPYDQFWQAVTRDWGKEQLSGGAAIGRTQTANASLNAIYRTVRVKRTFQKA
jgi:hypothetical protein